MIDSNIEKTINLGETRKITMKIWIEGTSSFSVLTPTWELVHSNLVEDSGTCTTSIQDSCWLLSCIITPKGLGAYELKYKFGIGEEKIIKKVKIQVI